MTATLIDSLAGRTASIKSFDRPEKSIPIKLVVHRKSEISITLVHGDQFKVCHGHELREHLANKEASRPEPPANAT